MAAPDRRRALLSDAQLYFVVDAAAALDVVPQVDVDIVQLRDKEASDEEIVRVARALREHVELLIVNDRPDLAVEAQADGVHLGQEDMALEEARSIVGEDMLIGLSTHSPEQIDSSHGADYIGVGPVFETATKPGLEAVGVELVRYAEKHATKPWFAIGGIDAARAREIGAERIAVVRAIRDAEDPRAAAEALRG